MPCEVLAMAMALFGSGFLSLFVLAAVLQLSTCWLDEIKGPRGVRDRSISLPRKQGEDRPVKDVLEELKLVS